MRFANVEIARALLEHGASPNLGNKQGETAWHWLVSLEEQSDIDSLIELLSRDKKGLTACAQPLVSTNNQFSISYGGTPLHWAVEIGMTGLGAALVSCGADPLYEYRGVTPLERAIQQNIPDLVRLFLETLLLQGRKFVPHSSIVIDGEESIDMKEVFGQVLLPQVTAILPHHKRLIYRGQSWLDDMRQTLRVLRDHGCLASTSDMTKKLKLDLLRVIAFSNGSGKEVLEMIHSEDILFSGHISGKDNATGDKVRNADVWNDFPETILPSAEPVVIQFAIARSRAFSSSGHLRNPEQLLHQCCTSLNADTAVVEAILEDDISVDCVDELGRTALMVAVCNRNFEIATCLIHHGADLNAKWVSEKSEVNILFEYLVNNLDIALVPLKYLLEPLHPFSDRIPSLSVVPEQNATVLHFACRDGNPVIVAYLLSKINSKEILNQGDFNGWSPLHFAAFYGYVDIAIKLCLAGVDVNIKAGNNTMRNRNRATPLDFCFRWHAPAADLLKAKYGLERMRDDVYIGRLRIAEYLVRRHKAHRAHRKLVHTSMAQKFAIRAAENGMIRLLAETMRRLKREDVLGIYPALLDALLVVAADQGQVGTTRLLLSLGAEANQRVQGGLSLLHLAAWRGKAEIVYVLVKTGGADINVENESGETPGCFAYKSQNLATLRVVKSFGGVFTLPRERLAVILEQSGLDLDELPPGFNLHFNVSVAGEPSDEEDSDTESKSGENEAINEGEEA